MALARWQATIVNNADGSFLANATVEVRNEEDNALAVIFSDRDGLIPLANPFTADAEGFAFFHAAGGSYRIQTTSGSLTSDWRYVPVGLGAETDGAVGGVGYNFDSNTAVSDPGAGSIRLNNATPASATTMIVSATDALGFSQSGWLNAFNNAGTATDRGLIILRSASAQGLVVARIEGNVTEIGAPATHYTVPISVLSSSAGGSFVQDDDLGLQYYARGLDGQPGQPGNPGPPGTSANFVIDASDHGFATGATAAVNTAAILTSIGLLTGSPAPMGPAKVFLPRGFYNINPFTMTGDSLVLEGAGDSFGGTVLHPGGGGVDSITITGSNSGLRNMVIQPTERKFSGAAVRLQTTFQAFVDHVRIEHAFNGILLFNAGESRLDNIQCRNMFGFIGIHMVGDAANRSFRAVVNDYVGDNPTPMDTTSANVRSYAANTAYAVGDLVASGIGNWQCVVAGTSGPSGTLPTNPPGTTVQEAFLLNFLDGTAQWRFVWRFSYTHIVQDSFAYSLVVNEAACINGDYGFRQIDSVASGTSYPTWAFTWDLECDHNFRAGVDLQGGEGCYITGGWIGSSQSGPGLNTGTGYRGELAITAGTRIHGNALHGVLIDGGLAMKVDSCFITANSQQTINSFNGITVGLGAGHLTLTNNSIGVHAGFSGVTQANGILINGSDSPATGADTYVVTGNNVAGNTTGIATGRTSGPFRVVDHNAGG